MRISPLALLTLLAACATTSTPADEPGTTTYVLRHQSAAEVAPILEEVLQSRGTVRHEPVQQQTTAPVRIEVLVQLQVRADPTRNALLMRGTTTQVNEALELARRLDVPEITIPGAR